MKVLLQNERLRAAVGWADPKQAASTIVADDVSATNADGIRGFYDGSMAGILRSLRSRRVVGNLRHADGTVDPEIFVVEPEYSGGFVPANEAASKTILDWSTQGFYVIAPVSLAYDTPNPQYLWKSATAAPATNTDEFAVLVPPGAANDARLLAFDRESGGGG